MLTTTYTFHGKPANISITADRYDNGQVRLVCERSATRAAFTQTFELTQQIGYYSMGDLETDDLVFNGSEWVDDVREALIEQGLVINTDNWVGLETGEGNDVCVYHLSDDAKAKLL